MSDRALLRTAAYACFLVLAVIVAYFSVCNTFGNQDDEGYVLLSLKQFLSGGALYHSVFTQYGPFPYELWGAVFKIFGLSATPNTGRVIGVLVWLLTSLLIGFTVERLTHSVPLGLAGAVVGFAADSAVANDPMHPGCLAATLIIAIMAVVTLVPRRRVLQMAAVGFLLAALVLTKINIGASAVLATLLAASVVSPILRRWRYATALLVVVAVLMPFVVMAKNLDQSWAEDFAALIALGAAAIGVCLTSPRVTRARADEPEVLGVLAAAFVATLVVILVVILALGTSVHDVIEGVLVRPLAQPNVFTIPALLPTLAVDLGLGGLVCAFASRALEGHTRRLLPAGAVRVGAAVLMWLWVSGTFPFSVSPNPTALGICIPLSWLALVPVDGPELDATPSLFVRAMLTTVPVLGAIVAYPVAGDQMNFAALAFVPVGGVILGDGLRALKLWNRTRTLYTPPRFARLVALAAAGLLAVVAYQVLLQAAVTDGTEYRSQAPLPFAGATLLRQPAATTKSFEQVVDTVRTRCQNFITLPGMNSFYLWAHVTPPTGLNATTWMYLLNTSEQQRIVDAVAHIHPLCLIRNNSLLSFWITAAGAKAPPARPLWAFVQSDFKPIVDAGAYEVLVRST